MIRKQLWIVIVTMVVLGWSVVMTALGQIVAIGALVPSLGLLVHQIVQALQSATTSGARQDVEPATAVSAADQGHSR